MLNPDNLILFVATLLLIFVDWLAFHDFLEPHTVRDWLMLAASFLVFILFARGVWKAIGRKSQPDNPAKLAG